MAVVIIDAAAHRHAADWYNSGRAEPGGRGVSLTSDSVLPLRHITLDSVLTEIARRGRRGGDVILVCHARDLGLALSLRSGSPVRARSEAIGVLAHDTESSDSGLHLPPISVSEAAPMLMMSEEHVTDLRTKMNQVRALGLRHVALRGCNVGSWENTLPVYKLFFGCSSLSGPMMRDTYGQIRSGAPEANLAGWNARHPGWHVFTDGTAPNQVAIATRGGDAEEHAYQIEFAPQSSQALQDWGTRHLGGPVSGAFYYHGMWRTNPAPGEPRINFVGDAAYLEHLRIVR